MIDIARDPRWGRIVEGAGEDPYLGSRMAVAQVNGYQGGNVLRPGSLMATAKHFGAYGAADRRPRLQQRGHLRTHAAGSLSTAVLRRGARRRRVVHGRVQRHRRRAHHLEPRLLRGLLRERWGWQGLMVCDWGVDRRAAQPRRRGGSRGRGHARARRPVDMDMVGGVYAEDLRTPSRRIPPASSCSTKRCCASCA